MKNLASKKDNHRWKVLFIGIAANISFSMIIGGIPATAIFMRSSYGLTNSHFGWAMGMLGLGTAISEIPWGMLTDRLGDRVVLVTGLLSTAIVLLLMSIFIAPSSGYTPSFILLTVFLLLTGLLGSSVNSSSGRAIMAWFQEGERGLAMSLRQSAVPCGYGLGALLFPLLASKFGFGRMYMLPTVLCTLCAIYSWRWLHQPNDQKVNKSTIQKSLPPKVSPLKSIKTWKMVTAIGILCAPQFAILTFATIFVYDYSHSVILTSVALAIIQVGAIVSRIWGGRWTDKNKNRLSFLYCCTLLVMLSFTVLALEAVIFPADLTNNTFIVIIIVGSVILAGIFSSAWHGVAYTELATMVGIEKTGTALAMGNMTVFVVFFITPTVIPAILLSFGWSAVWFGAALSAVVAVILFPKQLEYHPFRYLRFNHKN